MKLLDKHNYVYRYIVCKEGNFIRDIFWTHLESINFLSTFLIILIIDSKYIFTNKYMPSPFETVGVTSTKMTYTLFFWNVQKRIMLHWLYKFITVCRKNHKTCHRWLSHIVILHRWILLQKYFLHHMFYCVGIIIIKNVRHKIKRILGNKKNKGWKWENGLNNYTNIGSQNGCEEYYI